MRSPQPSGTCFLLLRPSVSPSLSRPQGDRSPALKLWCSVRSRGLGPGHEEPSLSPCPPSWPGVLHDSTRLLPCTERCSGSGLWNLPSTLDMDLPVHSPEARSAGGVKSSSPPEKLGFSVRVELANQASRTGHIKKTGDAVASDGKYIPQDLGLSQDSGGRCPSQATAWLPLDQLRDRP